MISSSNYVSTVKILKLHLKTIVTKDVYLT